ncbi:MAG: Transcriptional regulatory protein RstA [uncultured Thiotrichaceae bacterium]|uniref:Transcriptional regulatory protein RstA n=1 Tax=uncultured Thiotrichaceae bacterium TaxID=298394 RepID=A0A6S6S0I0_9GAMM|nr:MAG: Transcriptional regulatory protein RstA [uncultured Thiotrichaceae bacterium]
MTDQTHYHSILLVEDDKRLSDLMVEYLQKQGMKVDAEYRGDTAVQRILDTQPDLIILDLMLPGLDGLEVCRKIRPYYDRPILMLTAKDEDIDQVVGLELGADDYVIKPVQPRVLLARIRTLLRRVQCQPDTNLSTELHFGRLHIKPAARLVLLNNQEITLTTQEYDLLFLFASRAGEILTRDTILEALNGTEYDGLDRSVDIRISRLRKLLENNPTKPTGIKTVRGQGYLFVADGFTKGESHA